MRANSLFYTQAHAEEGSTKVAHGPRGGKGEKLPLPDFHMRGERLWKTL